MHPPPDGSPAVTAGVDCVLRAWIRLGNGELLQPNAPSYTGTSIIREILWPDASGNSLGSPYRFLTTGVNDSYQAFDLVATAPVDAVGAEVLLFLQGGGLGGIDQTAYFDDVSFGQVPEPGSAVLVMVGLGALALRARSRGGPNC